jgi:hypothetical protein
MRAIVSSIEGEWRRYKALADRALQQVHDDELGKSRGADNSVAVVVVHIAGNLKSRFTDFLTSDGEKPWRQRDSEFTPRPGIGRAELLAIWEDGWRALFAALEPLNDADLSRIVTVRGEKFQVHEALLRLVTHTSYHVGQIVFLAKSYRGNDWDWLTIPPGMSDQFNQNPIHQRSPGRSG